MFLMKKFFAIVLSALMVTALAACGGSEPAQSSAGSSAPTSAATSSAVDPLLAQLPSPQLPLPVLPLILLLPLLLVLPMLLLAHPIRVQPHLQARKPHPAPATPSKHKSLLISAAFEKLYNINE